MTEEMIINGVDVSGCKYAENSIPVDCNIDTCFCYENNNCYYKQLKRLEQENQELGKIIGCKNGTIASLVQIRDELKQENAKLKEKLEKILNFCKILEDVKEARAHGDLSENFEYHAAKRAKNQNESRIRFLERMIRTARIIEDHTAADEAGINKTVTIYVPEDDAEEVYTIVSTIREDSLLGLISVESPLGKALLGHRPGDRVSVRVNPDFSYDIIVRKVEDAGDAADAELARY